MRERVLMPSETLAPRRVGYSAHLDFVVCVRTSRFSRWVCRHVAIQRGFPFLGEAIPVSASSCSS